MTLVNVSDLQLLRHGPLLMLTDMIIPNDVLIQHRLSLDRHVATTQIANVWRVIRADGSAAALKVYNNRDPKDEAAGFDLMQAAKGNGCAAIYACDKGVALMEWLDGHEVGDISRAGDDDTATNHMIACGLALHQALPAQISAIRTVYDDAASLFDVEYAADFPQQWCVDFDRAKTLARWLLDTQGPMQPLHGDFHHDNVILTPRGPIAIDAKGVMGEAAYEPSNMFRNPVGAQPLYRDVDRAKRLAGAWAQALGCSSQRILQWAAVRVALSIIWDGNETLQPDARDCDLVGHYLALAEV